MGAILLPLEKNPWIQAYQIRNFELGILQEKQPWVFCNYINCYYDKKAKDKFCYCAPLGRYGEKENVSIVQKFRFDKSIFDLEAIEFLEWAKELLSNNWYIMGLFDEYYIPAKASYMKYHFRHSLLIYGYDDDKDSFYAIGYNKNRKYEPHTLTYKEYLSAISVDFDREKEAYYDFCIDKIEFDAFKLNPEFNFEFDWKELYTSLCDYINSTDSRNNKKDVVFGVDCGVEFSKYISNLTPKSIDIRYSRFFMELKDIMVKRLEYLCSIECITENIVATYKEIAEMQQNIHMMFIKYSMTGNNKIIDQMTLKMNTIIEKEKEILPIIRDKIYLFCKKEYEKGYI